MLQAAVGAQNGCAASVAIAKHGKALASKAAIETVPVDGADDATMKVEVLISIGAIELLQTITVSLTTLTCLKALALANTNGTTSTKCKAVEPVADQ